MKKILIANRGEIACRVARTARRMGIKSVAIYSEADQNALHTEVCDEAYCIGPSPSAESYLVQDKIIQTAITTGCDAIHPGYGFLSENALFSDKVKNSGLIFIGPDSSAISTMGSKLAAKAAVQDYGIPLVPGTDYPIEDESEAATVAENIGFPILIKASAGGGGKGMRIVHSKDEFSDSLQMAQGEAKSAFGDGSVFIEKYVSGPRHIEFQVLADNHGHVVHLFERECSIQRRHQKVVEEAPSVVLTPELRKQMGKAAVDTARACHYTGAGTVEFLLDDQNNFYFLEMNTRLQVEHPVTEEITGLDLVEQQIRVARGEKLSFTQDDLEIKGHSLEIRLYAEDAFNQFLPSIGTLDIYRPPTFEGFRLDNGYREGDEIPVYYDPMLAKMVTYGPTRAMAIEKMKRAIHEFDIQGIETTLPFAAYVLDHEAFISGNFDTHFVMKYWSQEAYDSYVEEAEEAIAALILKLEEQKKKMLNV